MTMSHFESLMMFSGAIALGFAIYVSAVDPTKTPRRIMLGYYLLGSGLLLTAAKEPALPAVGSLLLLGVVVTAIYYTSKHYHIRSPQSVFEEFWRLLNQKQP